MDQGTEWKFPLILIAFFLSRARRTYNGVIYKQLDKVQDDKDGNEGVQVNVEAEAPFYVLVSEVWLHQLVRDIPQACRNH